MTKRIKESEITVTIAPDITFLDGDMWGCVAELKKIGFIFEGGRWTAHTKKEIALVDDIIPILAKAGKTVKHPVKWLGF